MANLEGIKSVDELRKAQGAAQAQGTSITNYNQWQTILQDFESIGVQSTGSYEGDLQLHTQITEQIEAFIEEAKEAQKQQEMKPSNDESSKIDDKTAQDREQVVKANVVNGVSSDIMSNYMKFYHLL